MKLKEIFKNNIDRDIKGVIKVNQDENEILKQELLEYVVTKELMRHFKTLFSNYKKGITGETDKMGVWISGFFGSGKSHFLKIIAHLLENKDICGKPALDYFIDDQKINDSTVITDMKLASSVPTDVIIFNIDSRSEINGKQNRDAIGYVFLKVFNEALGFCGADPHVADLERNLSNNGRFDEFVEKFEELYGSSWIESRDDFDYIQDDVVDTLTAIGFMSEASARNICEKAAEPYSIDTKSFAELVKKYIDKCGKNHHVVFLVDEMGQYIGENNDLMLNLQTVTEDLGAACHGKAWVMVTSQQDIDSITNAKRDNFSKIQGRFDTRLSLSSANADEVIKKRILLKNDAGKQTLSLLYQKEETSLRNKIIFSNVTEKKLYADCDDFIAVYPFIPYQFNLLGSILTAIRTHGASGRHLADGERSLLALCKEAAAKLKDEETGKLVPLYSFYDCLEQFLDHSYSSVIRYALETERINPGHSEECFTVNVIKTLFLVKYIKEVNADVTDITSFMISSLSDDRMSVHKQVKRSLKILADETLISKNAGNYIFLTNEEQEINRSISSQPVENTQLTFEVMDMLFNKIYDEDHYRYPKSDNRYMFRFNRVVDDKAYKVNHNYDITLKILTPDSEERGDDSVMRLLSGQSECALVVMPDDRAFIDEIRSVIQIERFLKSSACVSMKNAGQISASKQNELRERRKIAEIYFEEALKQSDIYVNGDKIKTSSREIRTRFNEAIGKLVSIAYHKLTYIDTPCSEDGILSELVRDDTFIDGKQEYPNKFAVDDIKKYISNETIRHMKVSVRTLTDRFTGKPYGFNQTDVRWIVAKLFRDGDINLYFNNEEINLVNRDPKEIYTYITQKEFNEKLLTEERSHPGLSALKAAKNVIRSLFDKAYKSDDADLIMSEFIRGAAELLSELEKLSERYSNNAGYPGKQTVMSGIEMMKKISCIKSSQEFYSTVKAQKDDLLDFADDYAPVNEFFTGGQAEIFDKAVRAADIYEKSKTFIDDKIVEALYNDIITIIRKPYPYMKIHRLPDLIDKFSRSNAALLVKAAEPVKASIDDARKRVFEYLDENNCRDKLSESFAMRFDELTAKLRSCDNVASIKNITAEADALKVRCLNEINFEKSGCTDVTDENNTEQEKDILTVSKAQTKQIKTISIRSVNSSNTWRIECKDDVKKYIAELEKKLMAELKEDTVVDIEF